MWEKLNFRRVTKNKTCRFVDVEAAVVAEASAVEEVAEDAAAEAS